MFIDLVPKNKKTQSSLSKDSNRNIRKNAYKSFIQLFQEQVNNNPNAIAVVAEDGQITYTELSKRSDKLAKYLIALGVKKESLVGLCTSLTTNFITCMLGILKSGAAYFPLDPTYPNDRLQFMLQDGKPSVIVTESKYACLFDPDRNKIVKIDEELDHILKENDGEDFAVPLLESKSLAYVIYTSGSTGSPKGIMVTHQSLPNIALAHNHYYPSNIRMLISGGVCFDASLLIILHALINNEPLYLFNYNPKENIKILLKFIEFNSISYMICVPSQYSRLLQENCPLPFLKCVSLTGENLPSSLSNLHAKLAPNALLYNEYGPSECAIGTTIAKIYDPKDQTIRKITIGKPLPNTQVYILDDNLHTLPKRAKGEICIGGMGLARGYLNNEALTNEKFIWATLPRRKPIRLYRTGDLGRFLSNGELEFLGRADNRAYIHGKWADLGEVEYHLSRFPYIKESALLVQKKPRGKNQLVAYITSSEKGSIKHLLTDYLRNLLPKDMIPSSIIQIDKFPLSPNGKIDKDALVKLYA